MKQMNSVLMIREKMEADKWFMLLDKALTKKSSAMYMYLYSSEIQERERMALVWFQCLNEYFANLSQYKSKATYFTERSIFSTHMIHLSHFFSLALKIVQMRAEEMDDLSSECRQFIDQVLKLGEEEGMESCRSLRLHLIFAVVHHKRRGSKQHEISLFAKQLIGLYEVSDESMRLIILQVVLNYINCVVLLTKPHKIESYLDFTLLTFLFQSNSLMELIDTVPTYLTHIFELLFPLLIKQNLSELDKKNLPMVALNIFRLRNYIRQDQVTHSDSSFVKLLFSCTL